EIAVAVDPGVDNEIQFVRVAAGPLQAVLAGGNGQVQRAVPATPSRMRDGNSINDRSHIGSPNPRPGSPTPHRSPAPRPTPAARFVPPLRCVPLRVPPPGPPCESSTPCCHTDR